MGQPVCGYKTKKLVFYRDLLTQQSLTHNYTYIYRKKGCIQTIKLNTFPWVENREFFLDVRVPCGEPADRFPMRGPKKILAFII